MWLMCWSCFCCTYCCVTMYLLNFYAFSPQKEMMPVCCIRVGTYLCFYWNYLRMFYCIVRYLWTIDTCTMQSMTIWHLPKIAAPFSWSRPSLISTTIFSSIPTIFMRWLRLIAPSTYFLVIYVWIEQVLHTFLGCVACYYWFVLLITRDGQKLTKKLLTNSLTTFCKLGH